MEEVPEPLIGELYLRKSRALGDADDPELLAHHRTALLRLAAADGVHIPPENVIEEIGSAETISGRPKFAALLSRWERGQSARVLYVAEIERLSRGSLAEIGRIVEALSGAGVRIRTLSRWYNLREADDEFFYALTAFLGRRELGKYKERARLKLDALLREGRIRNGAVPFGYVWERKQQRPEPDPETFPVLKALLREAFRFSTVQLADRYGLPLHIVERAIHSPTVCGWPARRSAPIPGLKYTRPLPRSAWQWPEKPGDYEPAISRPEWERLQEVVLARHRGRNRPFSPEGWCRGIVRFLGAPDGLIRLGTWRSGGERGYLTYELPTAAPPLLYIDRVPVHQAAESAVRQACARGELLAAALADYSSRVALSLPQDEPQTAELHREIGTRRAQLGELVRLELAAATPERRLALQGAGQAIEQEIAALQGRIQAAAVLAPRTAPLDRLLEALPEFFSEDWEAIWSESEARQVRREIVEGLIAGVEVVVEPGPTNRTYRRAVTGVRYLPWLEPYIVR